jgi:D-alanyl-D-alanine carboxypeptidase/D-alanyl-D-alanine-endopeptidase (penicillin-binding protein 4)
VVIRWTRRVVLAAVVVCLGLIGRPVAAGTQTDRSALTGEIDNALADPAIKGGIQCVIVGSLRSGETWYERNADMLMMPASNQKLITSAAALHLLGPDFRYVTRVYALGSITREGVLSGDLLLRGAGDPFLDDAAIKTLAQKVRAQGIRRITGAVIGDGSAFSDGGYGDGWAWDDMTYYYSVPVSALNLNSNVLRLRALPGKQVGAPALIHVEPIEGYSVIRNRVRTAARGVTPRLSVSRELGRDVIEITGHVPIDAEPKAIPSASVSVQNPPLYAAAVLTQALRGAGVRVIGDPRTGVLHRMRAPVVAAYSSPPLGELLARLNKPSDNLAAECFLRTIGMANGQSGSVAAGRKAAQAWFASIGMDPSAMIMMDGSGLSRQNYVSGRNLFTLLKHMHTHPQGDVFKASLPVAGVDGTLRNRMKGTPAANNCRAKTGYVSNVSSLSGYVTTTGGEPLVFVILMNNHPCRNAAATAVQDRIVRALASYP